MKKSHGHQHERNQRLHRSAVEGDRTPSAVCFEKIVPPEEVFTHATTLKSELQDNGTMREIVTQSIDGVGSRSQSQLKPLETHVPAQVSVDARLEMLSSGEVCRSRNQRRAVFPHCGAQRSQVDSAYAAAAGRAADPEYEGRSSGSLGTASVAAAHSTESSREPLLQHRSSPWAARCRAGTARIAARRNGRPAEREAGCCDDSTVRDILFTII